MDTEDNKLRITPLGAGQEVGRSCVIMEYMGKTIMFDCGLHPARSGKLALPYFENIKTQYIDLLVVTHFHLDHCGAVPYLLEQTDFKIGKIYMTAPTKAIYNLNLSDYIRVSSGESKLFDKKDLDATMKKIDIIDYHQDLEWNGIKFTCYNAGHVLGAAMFLVDINGVKILYTGDYSREEDKHILPAEIPNIKIDILIVESTFGANNHQSRQEREQRFTDSVHAIVKGGGKCLLPVFVSGRAQELLLMLDEYWDKNPDIKDVPIYYASSLASKCMHVFETYINMMGNYVKQKFKEGINPFLFKYVKHLEKMDENFDEQNKSCVMMASPGMLQNGLSRTCFEKWCHDERNGVIITGYCIDGTLAKELLDNPREVKRMDGTVVERKIQVKRVIFCAHADFAQTTDYINSLKPKNIILVHGEKNEATNLMERLKTMFKDIRIESPQNKQEVVFEFEPRNEIQVLINFWKNKFQIYGSMAKDIEVKLEEAKSSKDQQNGQKREFDEEISYPFKGVMVKQSENEYLVVKDEDILEILRVPKGTITQKVLVPFCGSLDLILFLSNMVFNNLNIPIERSADFVLINAQIMIRKKDDKNLQFEWVASKKNDIIADQLGFLFTQVPPDAECDIFTEFQNSLPSKASFLLREAFPGIQVDIEGSVLKILAGEDQAIVNLSQPPYEVQTTDEAMKKKIESILIPYLTNIA